MIGVRNRVYGLCALYSAARSVEGYHALGSGAEVAIGALHAVKRLSSYTTRTLTRGDAQFQAQLAMEAARAHSSSGVLPPWLTFNVEGAQAAVLNGAIG